MLKLLKGFASVLAVAVVSVYAEGPDVSFSGYLDADVWANMSGSYFTNSELDLGMSLTFSEKLAAHVYATVNSAYETPSGLIPAGGGAPDGRWIGMAFDGYDLTYTSSVGTFTVGDLVYQYGKFNYYFYKRLSMITTESFTRGLKYSFGNDMVTQDFTVGIADKNSSTADIQGSTGINLGSSGTVGVYYGVKNDALLSFETGSDIYAGAEYKGSFGEMLSLKADFGYMGVAGGNSEGERLSVISVLVEPTLTMGNFSAAFTAFYMYDGDTLINSGANFGLLDEMFFYLEPGYKFTDLISAGLPLEYHAGDIDNEDDDAFWTVPTLYVTLNDNVQWWIWGQMVAPLAEDSDLIFAAGSEIIVNF